MRVSLFIAADPDQIAAAARIGAPVVELHTGRLLRPPRRWRFQARDTELARLVTVRSTRPISGSRSIWAMGWTYETVPPIAALPEVAELNIGHFLMGEALFVGLAEAIAEMRRTMDAASVLTGGWPRPAVPLHSPWR
jgi:pyridoxine 5-phosphate synthase